MITISYDFHLHSCLSPCGDSDMTPGNIVGMAAVNGLEAVALTDHNTCKNCPAFLHFAREYDILALPGMELTTLEEVHVVCLFPDLEKAMTFDSYVYTQLQKIPNNEKIFGSQEIRGVQDELLGKEPNLLINATNISFDQVFDLMIKFGGIMIPAHIDKTSNSLIANLGFIPPSSHFTCAELKNLENLHRLRREHPYLEHCKIITDSDAHYLEHINEPEHTLYIEERTPEAVLKALSSLV